MHWEVLEKTVMFLGYANDVIGLIGVADEIKPSAKEALDQLRGLGLQIIMATGDNSLVANGVASKLGITQIHAAMSPEAKT